MSEDRAARLAAIKERADQATPGPWRWRGYTSSQAVYLQAVNVFLRPLVMGFRRWGMQSAQPEFNDDGIMQRPRYTVPLGQEHNDYLIGGIDHPDARFIEHSRADVDFLLSEVERLGEIAESWHLLEEHTRTCGVVCWWDDGQLCFQEAPATAGEFKDAARAERAREEARADGH
jgi:hypothetical protein